AAFISSVTLASEVTASTSRSLLDDARIASRTPAASPPKTMATSTSATRFSTKLKPPSPRRAGGEVRPRCAGSRITFATADGQCGVLPERPSTRRRRCSGRPGAGRSSLQHPARCSAQLDEQLHLRPRELPQRHPTDEGGRALERRAPPR